MLHLLKGPNGIAGVADTDNSISLSKLFNPHFLELDRPICISFIAVLTSYKCFLLRFFLYLYFIFSISYIAYCLLSTYFFPVMNCIFLSFVTLFNTVHIILSKQKQFESFPKNTKLNVINLSTQCTNSDRQDDRVFVVAPHLILFCLRRPPTKIDNANNVNVI